MEDIDGYTAIQLGFGAVKPVNVTKPQQRPLPIKRVSIPLNICEKSAVEGCLLAYNPGDTVICVDIFAGRRRSLMSPV